jgi:hypothetical protein
VEVSAIYITDGAELSGLIPGSQTPALDLIASTVLVFCIKAFGGFRLTIELEGTADENLRIISNWTITASN